MLYKIKMKKAITILLLYLLLNTNALAHTYFESFLPKKLDIIYSNIAYPRRVICCLLYKDLYALKYETKKFIKNTTFNLIKFHII